MASSHVGRIDPMSVVLQYTRDMTEHRPWDPDELAASWASPPGLGRCIGIGCGIGVVLSFIGIALPSVLAGMEWRSAVGFGVFVAFWGGLGFGSMMGGVVYLMRLDKVEAEADVGERSSRPDVARSGSSRPPSLSKDAAGGRRVA